VLIGVDSRIQGSGRYKVCQVVCKVKRAGCEVWGGVCGSPTISLRKFIESNTKSRQSHPLYALDFILSREHIQHAEAQESGAC
jgi:hypothetical protein